MESPIISKKIFIGLGEILWDLLPGGRQLGGAPANFAYHAHVLGATALPMSRIGDDALGSEILERLRLLGLSTACVQIDDEAPTGTVSVEILQGGRHRFTIHEKVAWDRIHAYTDSLRTAARADALCFGTLAQRADASRAAVQAIASAVPANALRIFDINIRQHFYSRAIIEDSLHLANVLKINDEELPMIAEMLALEGGAEDQLATLAGRYDLVLAALTRGARGSLLYASGRISDMAGSPVEVVDTIGAGDAFTAAMALGWLAGWDLDELNRRANGIASYVCTRAGATPSMPPDLIAPYTAIG